jgi:Ca2+/Na+ antiporter
MIQQAEQLVYYGLLFSAIMCVIGIIQNGHLMARKRTSDAQRKQSKKLFFVLLAMLVFIGVVSMSLHMKWI